VLLAGLLVVLLAGAGGAAAVEHTGEDLFEHAELHGHHSASHTHVAHSILVRPDRHR
jgi:hypothetical protein